MKKENRNQSQASRFSLQHLQHLRRITLAVCFMMLIFPSIQAQFVHPGLSHKKSDLDRMKYMVEAKIDPWYSSYQHMCQLKTAQYDYTVQGDVSIKTYGLDPYGWKDVRFNDDARAAYYGAIRWYIEGDERYAEKAVEAIMAWSGLTDHHQKMSLTSAPIWLLIEAAELIKHTYDGWSEADQKKFADMLVYPGYSTTQAPTGKYTWYWTAYKFDQARAGNQELAGIRTIAAMGVFLDNKIMYDRAMRYVSNLPAREDDLPYERGPRIQGPKNVDGSTPYSISYDVPNPENTNDNPDWGYCGVLPYNIYPNGQNVESSRDQAHTCFSLGELSTLGEIAWSQGYNFFGLYDSRILTGLEYTLRYCVSADKSFPDQPTPWEPVTFVDLEGFEEPRAEDASADFIQMVNRTKRNKSINISPSAREEYPEYNTWELPIAHYVGRGLKNEDDVKWTIRARDYARVQNGTYEPASTGQDYTGYGALSYYRVDGCLGDPITGFNDTLPIYDMHVVPCLIEAENYDYNPINAEGRIYHDADAANTTAKYRLNQGVDVDTCMEGGYQLSSLEDGEWLSYTIAVREAGYYNVKLRYAAANGDGKIKFAFANEDKTDDVALPFGEGFSTGMDVYADFEVASKVLLQAGVQAMKVQISGASNSFVINTISIEANASSIHIEAEDYNEQHGTSVVTTSDSEGKSHVESFNDGDWLAYDIYIPYTQNYNFGFRLASTVTGEYEIILDEVSVENFAFSASAGADVWESQISSQSFALRAGTHSLKIKAKTSGSKLNWIDLVRDETICDVTEILPYFTIENPGGIKLGSFQTDSISVIPGYHVELAPTPDVGGIWNWEGPDGFTSTDRILTFDGIQTSQSGSYIVNYINDCGSSTKDTFLIKVSDSLVIEAESFSDMSGVSVAPTMDIGEGFVVTELDNEDYLEYEVTIPYTGTYRLGYRVSSESNEGMFDLSVDGELVESISFDATGNAETWMNVSSGQLLTLNEGSRTIKLVSKSATWNINWMQLKLQDLIQPCELPFVVDELSFREDETLWSSGVIDISCAESVNVFMDVKGAGALSESDYLNILYRIDGGEEVALLENAGVLSSTKITEIGVSGSTIEIIVRASTSSNDKVYSVSDLKIMVPPVFNRIEAEDFFTSYGIQTERTSDVDGNENVGWVHNGDWLMYDDIDLTGAMSFSVRLSAPASGNYIEMRLDSVNGPLVGNLRIVATGSFKNWQTKVANIIPTDGIFDVYFVLKGGAGYLFNVNWFKFSSVALNISSDASVTSSVYPVNNEANTITIERIMASSSFSDNISPAAGATFEIYKEDGLSLAGSYLRAGYKVIVTAADGITKKVYTIDYVSAVDKLQNQVITVYPNPVKDKLYVRTESSSATTYNVVDMFGKRIDHGVIERGESDWELDVSDWARGMYALQLMSDNGQSIVKVIKQ